MSTHDPLHPTTLTVLYDADCPVCRHARRWVEHHRQLVPVRFVPAGSETARRRFPELDVGSTLDEITVITDRGAVLRGDRAWTAVLWAVAATRTLAIELAGGRSTWRLRGAMSATDAIRRRSRQRAACPDRTPSGQAWPPPPVASSTGCSNRP